MAWCSHQDKEETPKKFDSSVINMRTDKIPNCQCILYEFQQGKNATGVRESIFHLFRSMQHALCDRHFQSVDDIQKWLDEFLASKQAKFFRNGIHHLPIRRLKVINNNGDYFD